MGDALGIPVHGVATHDAMAAGLPGRVLVVTDARRREVYWSLVVDGVRTHGPEVVAPAVLAERLENDLGPVDRVVGDAAPQIEVDQLGAEVEVPGPTPAGLVAVAAAALRAGTSPAPLAPLYLRRPDAVPPGAPKTVTRA
jgi:tRNA threonylcarbamoyl adenosine modification protein YeaZ